MYLVDNSAWQRLRLSPHVDEAMRARTASGDRFAICSASLDEACYSARSLLDLVTLRERFTTGAAMLDTTPEVDLVVRRIREALFAAGKGRAAGVVDVQIAAVAVHHGSTVLHYDADYDHIASVTEELDHEWVVSQGSVA